VDYVHIPARAPLSSLRFSVHVGTNWDSTLIWATTASCPVPHLVIACYIGAVLGSTLPVRRSELNRAEAAGLSMIAFQTCVIFGF
jgi:hypothetical protein